MRHLTQLLSAVSRSTAVLALGCATILAVPAAYGAQAPATASCPGANRDFDYAKYAPTQQNVYGVRAPILMRIDGTVCSPDGFAAEWISVEQTQGGDELVQIGEDHHYDVGGLNYCKFWAHGTGYPHFYECGGFSNGTFNYFKIVSVQGQQSVYFNILDCHGDSSYGACTVEDNNQARWNFAIGTLTAETLYGGAPCTLEILGSTSQKQNIGTSTSPAQWITSIGGPPNKHAMTYIPATCGHYGGYLLDSNAGIATWDDRNSN